MLPLASMAQPLLLQVKKFKGLFLLFSPGFDLACRRENFYHHPSVLRGGLGFSLLPLICFSFSEPEYWFSHVLLVGSRCLSSVFLTCLAQDSKSSVLTPCLIRWDVLLGPVGFKVYIWGGSRRPPLWPQSNWCLGFQLCQRALLLEGNWLQNWPLVNPIL